jgi:putative Holliday junction resolvase
MSFKTKTDELRGPILALDLGEKRVGVAISDELLITVRRSDRLIRANWKQLVADVAALVHRFDAKSVVIGLPLGLDSRPGSAALEAERIARNLAQSLPIPVYLQDEKLTSVEARERLIGEGLDADEISRNLDSEAATVILRDFINSLEEEISPRRI